MTKKTNAKAPAVNKLNGLTPARKAALPSLRASAFNAGVTRGELVSRLFALCGATPSPELFGASSLALRVGYMAAALRNKGDNRDQLVLFAHCASAIENRQTKGKAHKAMSVGDEQAYSSAKAKLSTLCKDAGVLNPSANSKALAKRAPGGKPAKAAKNAKGAVAPKVPSFTNDNDLRGYIASQRVAMLGVMTKAIVAAAKAKTPIQNETSSAIQDALALLAGIAPTK